MTGFELSHNHYLKMFFLLSSTRRKRWRPAASVTPSTCTTSPTWGWPSSSSRSSSTPSARRSTHCPASGCPNGQTRPLLLICLIRLWVFLNVFILLHPHTRPGVIRLLSFYSNIQKRFCKNTSVTNYSLFIVSGLQVTLDHQSPTIIKLTRDSARNKGMCIKRSATWVGSRRWQNQLCNHAVTFDSGWFFVREQQHKPCWHQHSRSLPRHLRWPWVWPSRDHRHRVVVFVLGHASRLQKVARQHFVERHEAADVIFRHDAAGKDS